MQPFPLSLTLLLGALLLAKPATGRTDDANAWAYNFDNGVCRITRSQENLVNLWFEDDWRREPFLIIQVGGIRELPKRGDVARIADKYEFVVAEARKYGGTAGFKAPMPEGFLAWLSNQDSPSIEIGSQGSAAIDSSGLREAVEAWQDCMASRAKTPQDRLVFTEPQFIKFAGGQKTYSRFKQLARSGPTHFFYRAHVLPNGRATKCKPESTDFPDLYREFCDLIIAEAIFKPARSKLGRPVPGVEVAAMRAK